MRAWFKGLLRRAPGRQSILRNGYARIRARCLSLRSDRCAIEDDLSGRNPDIIGACQTGAEQMKYLLSSLVAVVVLCCSFSATAQTKEIRSDERRVRVGRRC